MVENQNSKYKRGAKEGLSKIWIGDDGIICAETAKTLSGEDVDEIMNEIEKVIKETPGEAKILIDIKTTSVIRSSQFRKKTADRIKDLAQNQGFKKIAISAEAVIMRTISSFIIAASGIKNAKIFTNKEEALRWLKES